MGFLDKVKESAKDAADKAAGAVQQGAEVAQAKLEETKQKKKVGDLKEELGGIVYTQRTGTATPDADAEITRIVGEIQAIETELAERAEDTDTAAGDAT